MLNKAELEQKLEELVFLMEDEESVPASKKLHLSRACFEVFRSITKVLIKKIS